MSPKEKNMYAFGAFIFAGLALTVSQPWLPVWAILMAAYVVGFFARCLLAPV